MKFIIILSRVTGSALSLAASVLTFFLAIAYDGETRIGFLLAITASIISGVVGIGLLAGISEPKEQKKIAPKAQTRSEQTQTEQEALTA